MKSLYFLILMLIFPFTGISQEFNCSHEDLIKYILEKEDLTEYSVDELKDYFFIIELNTFKTEIKDVGVYKFGLSITHTKRYLLLKDKESFKFVDIETIEDGVIDLCEFFKRNSRFSSNEVIEYIEKMINLFKSNQKAHYLKLQDHNR